MGDCAVEGGLGKGDVSLFFLVLLLVAWVCVEDFSEF
jgi:hypothetical protein